MSNKKENQQKSEQKNKDNDKHKNKNRINGKVVFLICIIVLALIAYTVVTLGIVLNKNTLFKQSYDQKDALGAYKALFSKTPETENRPYLGLQSAPLTIMTVIDFTSSDAKSFYDEKMPEIRKAYVDTGQARLYHKYIITFDELNSRTGRFIYVAASRCYNEFDFNNTIQFNQALFSLPVNGSTYAETQISLFLLAGKFQIPKESFLQCVNNISFKELYQDASETEDFSLQSPSLHLGVNGQDNIVLYGNPDMETIQKRMRLQQIKVGI
jgi:hypothetical protein